MIIRMEFNSKVPNGAKRSINLYVEAHTESL
jgi:hypothetical protein